MTVTRWGERAAQLYDHVYARRYRDHDDAIRDGTLVTHFSGWLGAVCERFGRPIDVLDMGCGTGRYFRALRHVRRLVGIDVSRAMLAEAQHPVGDGAGSLGGPGDPGNRGTPVNTDALTLVEGDFLEYELEPAAFDLVYAIGVLAEHSPFDARIARRVRGWLRPDGRFAFTAVHPLSFSVPRTPKRRAAEWLMPVAGPFRAVLRARLMRDGLYADEQRVREVLGSTGFAVESIELFESDVHLHCLTIARATWT